MNLQKRLPSILLVVALASSSSAIVLKCRTEAESPAPAARASDPVQTRLHGRVVNLIEALDERHGLELRSETGPVWAFEERGGNLYTLIETRASFALFQDPRLREKELILFGRRFPFSMAFEPTTFRSVKNNAVHELYYWCDICSIQSLSPADCACCQAPVELTEKPLPGAPTPAAFFGEKAQ